VRYLFSAAGRRALDSLFNRKSLVAFDFDGTLSPIVKIPGAAKLPGKTKLLLDELGSRVLMAIISGRSVRDLKPRVQGVSKLLIGNHGLEGVTSLRTTSTNARVTTTRWLATLKKTWGILAQDPGVLIESKTYSLAIHYRHSKNPTRARREIFLLLAKLRPLPRVIPGKCVVNLIPPGSPHKGTALRKLMAQSKLGSALYVGDDDTDEDVFSLRDPRIVTVRIGQKKSSQAQYYLKDQTEIQKLLKYLLRSCSKDDVSIK